VRVRIAAAAVFALASLVVGAPVSSLAVGRACAASQVHVAIVVDFDGVSSTTSTCVAVGSRDNGATVLAARARQLGQPAPQFGSSGLLCAIDGIPAHGCGETHSGKYAYWSYFHGTGGRWSYSSIGPAGTRVNAQVVEGWRWQPNGAGNPSDPPPRASATASSICLPAPPPRPPLPPPRPPAVAAHGQAPPPRSATGGTVPATAAPLEPSRGATTTARSGSRAPSTTAANSASSTVTRETSTSLDDSGLAAAHGSSSGDKNDGPPYGLLAGALLVGALAVGGVIVARRRQTSAS
jgi:hypothetical protein